MMTQRTLRQILALHTATVTPAQFAAILAALQASNTLTEAQVTAALVSNGVATPSAPLVASIMDELAELAAREAERTLTTGRHGQVLNGIGGVRRNGWTQFAILAGLLLLLGAGVAWSGYVSYNWNKQIDGKVDKVAGYLDTDSDGISDITVLADGVAGIHSKLDDPKSGLEALRVLAAGTATKLDTMKTTVDATDKVVQAALTRKVKCDKKDKTCKSGFKMIVIKAASQGDVQGLGYHVAKDHTGIRELLKKLEEKKVAALAPPPPDPAPAATLQQTLVPVAQQP